MARTKDDELGALHCFEKAVLSATALLSMGRHRIPSRDSGEISSRDDHLAAAFSFAHQP